ncbi:unnamed protein product [Protopolystoma xenopodis]|uniref:Uncharacterized protein n=1 Tax=Protopolystoma xenopodis TaxID=117903 RepID=A0A448XHU5_9PLAT|nr:unnamed protein product [Protopolystoma xenopodis]
MPAIALHVPPASESTTRPADLEASLLRVYDLVVNLPVHTLKEDGPSRIEKLRRGRQEATDEAVVLAEGECGWCCTSETPVAGSVVGWTRDFLVESTLMASSWSAHFRTVCRENAAIVQVD